MRKKVIMNKWDKYWRLTILKELQKDKYWRRFLCECECWNIKEFSINPIRGWKIKSCWCIVVENNINRQKTHWLNWKRIHRIFFNIKERCNNIKSINYKNYWGRWIKCEWDTFEKFHNDMIEWYNDLLQIDRIDVNWNYNKQNCRWVDLKTQARNKRNNVYYKWKTISQLREEKNISKWVFDNLRYKKKLSLEEIFW